MRLKTWLADIAQPDGFEILAVEVMPAHVHRFVSAPPKVSPSDMVRYFKGITSRRPAQAFQRIRRPDWGAKASLWAEGYDVGTAGQVSAETSKRSIGESPKA